MPNSSQIPDFMEKEHTFMCIQNPAILPYAITEVWSPTDCRQYEGSTAAHQMLIYSSWMSSEHCYSMDKKIPQEHFFFIHWIGLKHCDQGTVFISLSTN